MTEPDMQAYTLMHRDVPVFTGMFRDGIFQYATEFYDLDHLPVGCTDVFDRLDVAYFDRFLARRQVPSMRKRVLDLNHMTPMRNHMAGLSDQYWLQPAGSNLTYSRVNFFDNPFDDRSVFLFLFGEDVLPDGALGATPSCCVGGDLPKAWAIDKKGRRRLYKTSGFERHQEPYNDVIASRLFKTMAVSHVEYGLETLSGVSCAVCDCAIDSMHDFVPAADIVQSWHLPINPGLEILEDYAQFVEEQGLPDIRRVLSCQIIADYLMANSHRGLAGFGLIRNAENLQYDSIMPVFGNGSSLFCSGDARSMWLPAQSSITGLFLSDDLRFVKKLDNKMRLGVRRFPNIVETVLAKSSLPWELQAKLVDGAKQRSKYVLLKFDV